MPYFSKKDIYQLSEQYKIPRSTTDTHVARSLKRKDILSLKNGLYVTTDFYNKNISDISYKFYLANILRSPSYISSWSALQYYDLTTEIINTITSVTEKVTRDYQTKGGSFSYHSIKKEFFSEFNLIHRKFDFFIASPAKALFDLIYFRTEEFRGVTLDQIDPLVESLRVDIDEMGESEREKFYEMVKKHIDHE